MDFQRRGNEIFNVVINRAVFRKTLNCTWRIRRLSSSLIVKPNNDFGKYYTDAYKTNNCKNDENTLISLLKLNNVVWWKIWLNIPYCKILTKRVVKFGCRYVKRLLLWKKNKHIKCSLCKNSTINVRFIIYRDTLPDVRLLQPEEISHSSFLHLQFCWQLSP